MNSRKFNFIDLSQPLYNGIPLAGALPRFQSSLYLSLDAGDTCNCYSSVLSDHTGTHCDAPFHVLPDGKKLDQYPVDACSGTAICLDVTECEGQAITLEAMKKAESRCREMEKGDIVLFYTGHSRYWGKRPEGMEYLKNRPWIDPPATQYLINKKIKAIGIDVGGPDPLGAGHIVHDLLLSHEILIVETLTNLSSVVNREFLFLAFPLKLVGTSGAPLRAVAMLEE